MSDKLNKELEIVMPILVYIQANLHEDLSLESVSKKAGLSPYYFHRIFKKVVGESLKRYVSRIKLERAAFALRYWDEKMIAVSVELGFKNPETFTRAFKREFKCSPTDYKQQAFKKELGKGELSTIQKQTSNAFEVSPVTIKRLNPIDVAFIRNIGPYEDVDASHFNKLILWAKEREIYRDDLLLLGVGHDTPNITPKELQRFDCCIEVNKPSYPEGDISFQRIEGGQFATVTYVGPYGINMRHAYRKLYSEILIKNFKVVGQHVIEVYRTTTINPTYELNKTDIYVPVGQEV